MKTRFRLHRLAHPGFVGLFVALFYALVGGHTPATAAPSEAHARTYKPFSGNREIARRQSQLARGVIRLN